MNRKKNFVSKSAYSIIVTLVALSAHTALAQGGTLAVPRLATKGSSGSVASARSPSIEVRKTAFVDGQNARGVITIKNTGRETVTVSAIADFLEVHFPRYVVPPAHLAGLAGSTPGWFKVADILGLALPGPIAPRATATVPYSFPLCQALDFAGANSMRNVVAVTVTNASGGTRTVTTRSVSFAPPTLDCRACCLPDGSCSDTVPADCESAGGLPQAVDSECTTTECPEACCRPDDSCTDDPPSLCQSASGEPQGPGTDCGSTQCCQPLGPGECVGASDCCDSTAECNSGGRCCIPPATSGCTDDFDCCGTAQTCVGGICCGATGESGVCSDDTHCCDPNADCTAGGRCCIPPATSGCTDDFDCCGTAQACVGGICCGATGEFGVCADDSHCCDANALCFGGGRCCIPPATSGCTDAFDCCGTAQSCEGGKCCGATGVSGACSDDSHCCDPNALCSAGGRCCAQLFGACTSDFDCCSGFVCNGGFCDRLIGP